MLLACAVGSAGEGFEVVQDLEFENITAESAPDNLFHSGFLMKFGIVPLRFLAVLYMMETTPSSCSNVVVAGHFSSA